MLPIDVNGRRRYDNTWRAEQAAATRRSVLDATRRVLIEKGYSGATIDAIARQAGVSVPTVYKGFGTKRELVRQMLGMAVAGDDEPVPLAERPEMLAMDRMRSGIEILTAAAAQARQIFDRLGTLPAILLVAARAGEPELRGFAAEMGGKRLTDVTRIVRAVAATGDLRPDLDETHAADIMWTLGSPEVHLQLTDDRGWSAEDYESWLAKALIEALVHRP